MTGQVEHLMAVVRTRQVSLRRSNTTTTIPSINNNNNNMTKPVGPFFYQPELPIELGGTTHVQGTSDRAHGLTSAYIKRRLSVPARSNNRTINHHRLRFAALQFDPFSHLVCLRDRRFVIRPLCSGRVEATIRVGSRRFVNP